MLPIFDPSKATGPVYRNEPHPLIPFDRSCEACTLSCGKAVPGAGPADLSKVKLIVLSDYPGPYEQQYGWPQVPAPYVRYEEDKAKQKRRRVKFPWKNSGEFLRLILKEELGLDPWEEVFYTNGVQCSPFRGKEKININLTHIRPCVNRHVRKMIEALDDNCPYAPIVVAGGKAALPAFNLLYDTKFKSIQSMLHVKDVIVEERRVAFTNNPAAVAKGEARLISSMVTSNGVFQPSKVRPWKLLGTPQWHFVNSIKWLEDYL
jgi:hypothetical protein